MAPILQSLGIDRMSLDQRIAIATAIWEDIASGTHPSRLTEQQRLELDRRLADHELNPNDVESWEQIKAEALARFQK